jgi:glycosyltransferase involved in cell wall biosynthesis
MSQQQALKVLFLTSSYPRDHEDTASVFLRYLAEHLADRGLEIHVLAPADTTSGTTVEGKIAVHRFQYFPSRLQALAYGSGIMPNLQRSPWLWLQVPFFVLAMAYSLLRVIGREQIHLVHAHWILPQGLLGVAAKYLRHVPLVTTVHGADAFTLRGGLASVLKRFVVTHSDAWTTNTPATSRAVDPAAITPRAHMIPMGVDTELFAGGDPVGLRKQLPEREFLLLFVGRLVDKKGCGGLLEALTLLPPALRNRTTLWIVGDGDQRSQLEQTTNDLGLAEKVRFWGAISNQRLPQFYAAADLFVAPSIEAGSGDTEGQGVVILEAFAGQACVLTTRVGGIEAVVCDNVTGALVPSNRPRDLALAMEKLLNDPDLRARLVKNAFREVKERYDWKQIAGEFESLYRTLAKRPRRHSSPQN